MWRSSSSMANQGRQSNTISECGMTSAGLAVTQANEPENVFPRQSSMSNDGFHCSGCRVRTETLKPLCAATPAMTCPRPPPPQIQILILMLAVFLSFQPDNCCLQCRVWRYGCNSCHRILSWYYNLLTRDYAPAIKKRVWWN